MGQFASRLLAGLSLPGVVHDRIVDATAGFPFALEEGMIELIRDKEVRRIYGSFFFGGQESAHYRPSLRLVCHVEAEAARLGAAAPLRLAALADTAVPTGELAAAAEIFANRPADGWAERSLGRAARAPPEDTLGRRDRARLSGLRPGAGPQHRRRRAANRPGAWSVSCWRRAAAAARPAGPPTSCSRAPPKAPAP